MEDPNKEKSGDSSIDKMYEIFSKLFEQQQQSKPVLEITKYTPEPNPVKLSGPVNYIS